jgi:hypothetical protein
VSFEGGDICQIVPFSSEDPFPEMNGRTVVLVRPCGCWECAWMVRFICPDGIRMWLISGLPKNFHSVAEARLCKIPPAPMERQIPDLMEMVG